MDPGLKQFFGLKILKFFEADPEPEPFWPWRVEMEKFGSGIRDKHPGPHWKLGPVY
jgi:hypothetical protein